MPTATAIASGTLLDPGSPSPSASASHQNPGRHGASVRSDPCNSPAGSPVKDHSRPPSASSIDSTSSPSSLSARHHGPHGAGREQHPLFISTHQRPASTATPGAENNGRRNGIEGVSTSRGGGGRPDRAPAAGARARLPTKGYYISPKLYATPETTRITPAGSAYAASPTSDLSTSPYVVNRKRRDISRTSPPPLRPSASDNGKDAEHDAKMKPPPRDHNSGPVAGKMASGTGGGCVDVPEEVVDGERSGKMGEDKKALDTKSDDDALDENTLPDADMRNHEEVDYSHPRQLMAAETGSDTEDGSSSCRTNSGMYHTPLANQSDFYDASEDFFSDGSVSRASPSIHANIEADLCSVRNDLFEEIDRRTRAEEALLPMQCRFQWIARQLFQSGLSSPPMQPGVGVQCDVDSIAQLCQEVVVTRFVFEAVEVGLAHAEAQAAAEAAIKAKNHEIARLRDRLQYYEAVNREMSQRNQTAVEFSRRRRLKMRMCVWGCVGLSITMGASLLAYSYVTHGSKTPSLPSSECHDTIFGKE